MMEKPAPPAKKPKPKKSRPKRIPKSFNIAGHEIQVLYRELDDCFGHFDPVKLQIVIGLGNTKSVQAETFWHEVIEALNFFSEAGLEHKSIQVMGMLLHQVVDSFSHKNKDE
tara:strand:- start:224 stop:559 length:336 start_codon:yes stop_codon:yes gene_type:complete